MISLTRFFSMLTVLALAACGGGGSNTGTSGFTSGTGSGTATTPTAADLIVSTSSAQLPDISSSSLTITVTAVDSGRVVVSGAPIQLSADSDAVVTQSAPATDSTGSITGTLRIGANRANRVITITATSGALSKTVMVEVVGASVASTLVPAVVAPGATAQIQYRVTDQAGSAMTAQSVQVSAPGLSPATATGATDGNGAYVFGYTAPATAGSFTVSTTIGGVADEQTVIVQSGIWSDPGRAPGSVSLGIGKRESQCRAGQYEQRDTPIAQRFGHYSSAIATSQSPTFVCASTWAATSNSIGGTFTTGTSDRLQ